MHLMQFVQTGDTTPLLWFLGVAGVAFVIFIIVTMIGPKKRK